MDADRYGFGLVAVRPQNGDDLSGPPGVQFLLDPVHARLPLALVRRHGLYGGRGIFEGTEQLEDEDRIPSGENLLAGIPDTWHLVGQHRQFLGLEQAVPASELL